MNSEITFEECDFMDANHCAVLANLIEQYKIDEMGDGKPFTMLEKLRIVDGLSNHPAKDIFYILFNKEIIGLAVCFQLFSTFNIKPYLYIHDFFVTIDFRGKGFGRKLLDYCIDIAKQRKYCKICLEVRSDNTIAKSLYLSLGFEESEPSMHFLTKKLQ